MLIKLAWRNIWRNRTRTIITLASVSMAVVLSSLMMSAKNGVYDNMIKSLVGDFTGFLQVHTKGYWEDKNIDNSLKFDKSLIRAINDNNNIIGYSPRIESFALAVSDSTSKGTMVMGINVGYEKTFINLDKRIVKGNYLDENDQKLLVGEGLARFLKVNVGDTLVLLGQGYHGSSAAGKYEIKGLIKFGSPELSNQLIFLPIKEAQWFYGTMDMCTSIILHPYNDNNYRSIVQELKGTLGKEYEVMGWEELLPDLKNMIATDKVEGYVFMFILYMVISFGLFGTMLMMLSERKQELGVLLALGMKRVKMSFMVWLELVFISLLGVLLGVAVAFPICAYLHYNPIRFGGDMEKIYEDYGIEAVMQFSIDGSIFTQQALIIFLLSTVIAVFPFIRFHRMRAIKEMKG